jgi:hypothetical protein
MIKEEKYLYKFYWDCRRMGNVEGVFAINPEELKKYIDKEVYFGEILGKHSEVYGTLEEDDLTLLTKDQDFIKKAEEFRLIPFGYNPIDYIDMYAADEED